MFEPATGLSVDYVNLWTGPIELLKQRRRLTPRAKKLLDKELGAPFETYEEYFRNRNFPGAHDAMDRADPAALARLNEVVAEYNALDPRQRYRVRVNIAYRDRCLCIIRGQES